MAISKTMIASSLESVCGINRPDDLDNKVTIIQENRSVVSYNTGLRNETYYNWDTDTLMLVPIYQFLKDVKVLPTTVKFIRVGVDISKIDGLTFLDGKDTACFDYTSFGLSVPNGTYGALDKLAKETMQLQTIEAVFGYTLARTTIKTDGTVTFYMTSDEDTPFPKLPRYDDLPTTGAPGDKHTKTYTHKNLGGVEFTEGLVYDSKTSLSACTSLRVTGDCCTFDGTFVRENGSISATLKRDGVENCVSLARQNDQVAVYTTGARDEDYNWFMDELMLAPIYNFFVESETETKKKAIPPIVIFTRCITKDEKRLVLSSMTKETKEKITNDKGLMRFDNTNFPRNNDTPVGIWFVIVGLAEATEQLSTIKTIFDYGLRRVSLSTDDVLVFYTTDLKIDNFSKLNNDFDRFDEVVDYLQLLQSQMQDEQQ
jgi:hypothetical protein